MALGMKAIASCSGNWAASECPVFLGQRPWLEIADRKELSRRSTKFQHSDQEGKEKSSSPPCGQLPQEASASPWPHAEKERQALQRREPRSAF